MSKTHTNSGKSVKERLLNLSRAEHYSPQMMISRYMQERLLYRLSISDYRERFILKGGALLYAHDRFEARPTLDIDFMAMHINNDKENIKRIIKEICNVDCATDGTDYDAETIGAEDITVNKEYHEYGFLSLLTLILPVNVYLWISVLEMSLLLHLKIWSFLR